MYTTAYNTKQVTHLSSYLKRNLFLQNSELSYKCCFHGSFTLEKEVNKEKKGFLYKSMGHYLVQRTVRGRWTLLLTIRWQTQTFLIGEMSHVDAYQPWKQQLIKQYEVFSAPQSLKVFILLLSKRKGVDFSLQSTWIQKAILIAANDSHQALSWTRTLTKFEEFPIGQFNNCTWEYPATTYSHFFNSYFKFGRRSAIWDLCCFTPFLWRAQTQAG